MRIVVALLWSVALVAFAVVFDVSVVAVTATLARRRALQRKEWWR